MPSSSSKSSMSQNKYKCNWSVVLIVFVIFIIIFTLFYMSKNLNTQKDGFTNKNASEPNLTPKQNECVVALFYADWCPHCVAFKPDYKRAMSELNGKTNKQNKKIRLEMVDCDANKTIAKKHNVSGFPTVKIFNDDGTTDDYEGERTFIGIQNYLLSSSSSD